MFDMPDDARLRRIFDTKLRFLQKYELYLQHTLVEYMMWDSANWLVYILEKMNLIGVSGLSLIYFLPIYFANMIIVGIMLPRSINVGEISRRILCNSHSIIRLSQSII